MRTTEELIGQIDAIVVTCDREEAMVDCGQVVRQLMFAAAKIANNSVYFMPDKEMLQLFKGALAARDFRK